MNNKEVVLLLSGGIDSTTMLAELSSKNAIVHALSFDYGQRHHIELEYAKANVIKYKVHLHKIIKLDLTAIAQQSRLTNKNTEAIVMPTESNENYVPGRNLLMLSHAAAYAEAFGIKDIYFAANADDALYFPDCTSSFVAAMQQVWQCTKNTAGLKLQTPYITKSKKQVIAQSQILSVDLKQTLSCYAPIGNTECGKCMSCKLKQKAMMHQ